MTNEVRRSSHVTKKGDNSIHEPFDCLEKMVMSHLAAQLFPKACNRIEFRRIGGQTDQFNLILMSLQEGQHGFGKVDTRIIHDDILFASRLLPIWLDQLAQNRAKQRIVFVLARRPIQLATSPMDEPSCVLFSVLTGVSIFLCCPTLLQQRIPPGKRARSTSSSSYKSISPA